MEIKTALYAQLKQNGSVRPVKISGKTFAFAIKRFDPHTGAQLDDAIEQCNIDEMKRERDNTAAKLAGLDAMIADLQALK